MIDRMRLFPQAGGPTVAGVNHLSRPIGLLLALACTLFLAGCADSNSVTFRYKLTLYVDVDGRTKSGLTVVEVTYGKSWYEGSIGTAITGEALALEVRPGEVLVHLLTGVSGRHVFKRKSSGSPASMLAAAYDVPRKPSEDFIPWMRRILANKGVRDLDPSKLSDMVTFNDAADPKTVREVDPENIGAAFGIGTHLTRATIEITTEKITTGRIQKLLPWPGETWTKGFLGGRSRTISSGNLLADELTAVRFIRKGH
jgi:hypothetical protein